MHSSYRFTIGEDLAFIKSLMVYMNPLASMEMDKLIAFWREKYEPIEDEL